MALHSTTMEELGINFQREKSRRSPRRFMNWGEPEILVALAGKTSAEVFVEIGVNEGLTAAHLLSSLPSIKWYFGVDVLPGYVTEREVQRNEVPTYPGRHALPYDRFSLCLRPLGSLDLTHDDLPRHVDFMFIDGDHGATAVAHDTLLASECVRDEGIVAWHDYHHLGTVDVAGVLETLDAGCEIIKHIAGTWIAFATGAGLREALANHGGECR